MKKRSFALLFLFISVAPFAKSLPFHPQVPPVHAGYRQPRPDSSPNPIGDDAGNALKFVEFYASNDVDASLKRLIPHRKIIGIGGVHDYSLRQQFGNKPDSYTLTQLSTLAGKQVIKRDDELHGDYRATDVSNLLLVEGYMRALNIPEVTLVKASLVQGLLVR